MHVRLKDRTQRTLNNDLQTGVTPLSDILDGLYFPGTTGFNETLTEKQLIRKLEDGDGTYWNLEHDDSDNIITINYRTVDEIVETLFRKSQKGKYTDILSDFNSRL